MELIDVPTLYFLSAFLVWVVFFLWFVRHPEWIGAAVMAFFFLWPVAVSTLLGGRDIPVGQIALLFFCPPLLVTLMFRPAHVSWKDLFLLGAYGSCILMSIILSDMSLWANKAAVTPIAFAILLYLSVDSPKALYRVLYVYAALMMVTTFFAGLQRMGVDWAYLPGTIERADEGGFERGFGLARNFTKASLYATILIPVAVTLFLNSRRPVHLLVSFVFCMIGIVGQAFTISRSGVLGVVCGLWIVVKRGISSRAVVLGMALTVLTTFTIMTTPMLRQPTETLMDRILVFTRADAVLDESAASRPEWARQGLQVWLERPVFGGGPFIVSDIHGIGPHNTIVNVMASYGTIGLVFFLLILYRCYRSTLIVSRMGYPTEGTALGSALVATLPIAFFHSLEYVELFWAVPALCLAATRFPAKQQVQQEEFPVCTGVPYILTR